MDKKKMFYVQVWPYGIGYGGEGEPRSYAFETQEERDKWMRQDWIVRAEEDGNPVVSFADYNDMQRAYGNNFRIFKDEDGNLSVCSYLESMKIAEIADVDFF